MKLKSKTLEHFKELKEEGKFNKIENFPSENYYGEVNQILAEVKTKNISNYARTNYYQTILNRN